MTVDEKLNAIHGSKKFHDDNAEKIRFDPNVSRTVIFPANWHQLMSTEQYEFTDSDTKEQKTSTKTKYQVFNPNAKDPHKLREISASAALDAQISTCLEMALDQQWDGPIIATIKYIVQQGQKYGRWAVQGQPYQGELPQAKKDDSK